MATVFGPTHTKVANTDLSSYQFHIVTFETNGKIKLADDADVILEPLFVLMNKPSAEGQPAELALPGGIAKIMLGGSVDEGASITTDGSGHGIATTTAGDWVAAIAMEAGSSGDIIEVLVCSPSVYGVAP